MSRLDEIIREKIPQHVAIIMDGNGRWAKSQGKERIFGHSNGVDSVRAALKAATKCGVKYLTLYAFSTENWNRPKEEVDALMDLLVQTIIGETEELHKNEVRLQMIGDMENLPLSCKAELSRAIEQTSSNSKITLILALSYSSRWEITRAVRRMIQDGLRPEQVDERQIGRYLTTGNIPDPELLIRTSGEKRISNFLLWQIAYAELYFTETLWPDFTEEDFFEAILNYQSRERRFGMTSEQMKNESTKII
jgi:undecaprenyl diphosphate synthase